MIEYDCPKCGAEMNSPDSLAGHQETCPNCGNVAIVPQTALVDPFPAPPAVGAVKQPKAPPAVQPRINVRVERGKATNGLGVAALVLGIIAALSCWIPLVGIVSIPVASLGLLFGVLGFLIAAIGRRSGVGMPVAGSIVCIVAILVAVSVTSKTVDALDEVLIREDEPPNLRSLPGDTAKQQKPTTPRQIETFEIVSIKTRVTETNDVWWKYAWKLRLKSKSNRRLRLYAEIKFLDQEGFILDTDMAYELYLEPREEREFTGAALLTAQIAPKVASSSVLVKVR